MSQDLSSKERAKNLHDQWGFTCNCALCRASSEEREASDRRLSRMAVLEAALENTDLNRMATSASADELVRLYRAEQLHVPIAKAYRYAAFQYGYEGNENMMRRYATMAEEAYAIWEGPGSQNAAEMAQLKNASPVRVD